MQTSARIQEPINSSSTPNPSGVMATIGAGIVANLAIAAACIVAAITVVGLSVEEFGNLGRPVQLFAGAFLVLIALVAVFASIRLAQRRNTGRILTMGMHYVVAVLAFALTLQLWGAFLAFEYLTTGILANTTVLLGFPLAYILYWIAGKMAERSRGQRLFEMAALVVMLITSVLVLFNADILNGFSSILASYSNPLIWVTTAITIVLAILAWRILQLGDLYNESPDGRTAWQGWLLLSPNMIGFMIFFAGPLLLSLYFSFTDSSVGQTPNIIGLENYTTILSLEFQTQTDLTVPAQSVLSFGYSTLATIDLGESRLVIGARDTLFWYSLRNTLLFCLLLVPLAVIPALVLSLVLNSKLPGMKFFRAIYFLPSVAAVVGTALIWRWLYDPTIGYFNYIIESVVTWLNSTFGLSLTDPEILWLTDPAVVLFSMVFLSAWGVVGYNTVLFLAGLQGIPRTLYEAAMIDGANRWAQFRNVTLPMLGPTTFFVLITTIVTGLQVFNEPYTLFPAQPIPINATTSVYYLYRRGFFFFEFGYASAIAWLLFGIIFTITLIQFRTQRRNAYSD